MPQARLTADPSFTVGPVPPRLFGSFVEHMGRCVYTGIYEPGHATADQDGLRKDVVQLVRELGPTVVRYPGRQLRVRLRLGGQRRAQGPAPAPARPCLEGDRDQPVRPGRVPALVRRGRHRADDGDQPRHPRVRRTPATCSSTPTTRAARSSPTCGAATATRTPTASGCGASATRWTGPGRSGTRRPHEYGRLANETGEGDAPDRPGHRARRLRQLRLEDADLRRVGARRCSRRRTTPSTTSPLPRLLRGEDGRVRRLPGRGRRHGLVHRVGGGHGRRRACAPTAQQADQHLLRRVERLVPVEAVQGPRRGRVGRAPRASSRTSTPSPTPSWWARCSTRCCGTATESRWGARPSWST